MFGQAAGEAVRLWADEISEPGWVDLEMFDAHPDPVDAVRQAEDSGFDVLFGPYGRGPALAVARATSRLVWNGGGATSLLSRPRFGNVVNVLSPASSYLEGGLAAIKSADPKVGSLVIVHTARGFSGEVARGAMATASKLGMSCSQARFRPGKAKNIPSRMLGGDVLVVAGSFQDELDILRSLDRRRYKAVLSVAAGVDEVLEALGDRREALIGPAQWTPSSASHSLVGPDVEWFVAAYRRRVGLTPPYPAAQALAAALIWSECVRRTGTLDERSLAAEARVLDTRTLFGQFRVDPATGLQVGHRVVTVQWRQGLRRVIWPPGRAEANLEIR
jgi:branched-chain amino acid transport system substrate-binding protein